MRLLCTRQISRAPDWWRSCTAPYKYLASEARSPRRSQPFLSGTVPAWGLRAVGTRESGKRPSTWHISGAHNEHRAHTFIPNVARQRYRGAVAVEGYGLPPATASEANGEIDVAGTPWNTLLQAGGGTGLGPGRSARIGRCAPLVLLEGNRLGSPRVLVLGVRLGVLVP